jgi:hypothetical protein
MSTVELLNISKKILGKLPRTELSIHDQPLDRIMNLLSAPNHVFKPSINVPDTGTSLNIAGFLIYIKVPFDQQPVKVNLDRQITDTEYTVVYPGMVKVVSRFTNTLYLKAPTGFTSTAVIEALKLN